MGDWSVVIVFALVLGVILGTCFRIWSRLCRLFPQRVTVIVRFRGGQHAQRNVMVGNPMHVAVPELERRGEIDGWGGGSMTQADVDAIIDAGTVAEGSEFWPEEGLKHADPQDPFKGLADKDGNPVETRPVPQDVVDKLRDSCRERLAQADKAERDL